MNSDHKSKICPTEPWSTIVVLMLHDGSSESCDDAHFIASTALGGHRQIMARLLSWNAPLLRREIRTGPMASAKSRPTASRKEGRLLCGVKRLLEIRERPLKEFSSNARSKTRLLAASERCDQHFSSAIPHFETDSGAFYSPETVPYQQLSKIHRCTDVEF